MSGRSAGRVGLGMLMAVAAATAAHAQIGASALTGIVRDPRGTAVPGAAVTAVPAGTNLSRTAVTGPTGDYVLQGLAPGTYRLDVELSGFKPLTREGVRVATGETVRLDLALEVGGVNERVTVTSDAPSAGGQVPVLNVNRRVGQLFRAAWRQS